ncbi:hypothetical protein L9F63_021067 [Diploptera punctata]|uniref:GTP:AMP phosphotransferase, mitochondrial n=1 Tax=Diploptera punctata TaxID=6984 RepID=A0AAD7ZR39_DIPPU|nr:hypothetical protein L9F63_021067 [Diploptera punctata]
MLKVFKGVMIGAPASGKGTISSRIVKYFDVQHVSSGDVLRNHMLKNTEYGVKIKEYVNNGKVGLSELVPSSAEVPSKMQNVDGKNSTLHRFPRTRAQAEELSGKESITVALNLVVPFEIIIERVKGRWIHEPSGRIYNLEYSPPKVPGKDDVTGEDLIQRPDDQPEAVRKRLELYSANIEPVLEYYRKEGVLKEFAGNTSNEIWPKVYDYLQSYMKAKAALN